jgi:hypothetical protein
MKRIDDDDDNESWLKAAVYGAPGTGKTDFAVSAPKPLILLSERQGLATVRSAAVRRGVPVPPVMFMEDLRDYRDVLRALHGAKDKPFRVMQKLDGSEPVAVYEGEWPETVVIDSITDACEIVEAEVRREAPPEKAKDGLEKWTERHWATFRDRCEKLIRSFRNVPTHVLFLALQDDRVVGEGDEANRIINPMLPMRALPGFLCSCVNVVGITSRRIEDRDEDGQRRIVHEIRTIAPSHYMLKPFRPLRDIEEPDFTSWVERVRAVHAQTDTSRRAAASEKPENGPAQADLQPKTAKASSASSAQEGA